jgi:CheY-like chemotaxis protein
LLIVLDAHTDFLAKPFDLPALAAALDRLLATPA